MRCCRGPSTIPSAAAQITFTDPARADWLWRVLGEAGHSRTGRGAGPTPARCGRRTHRRRRAPGSLDSLRRLALGHWLRRWWPASRRDGIAALDSALLDGEVALLTAAAEDFFGDDDFRFRRGRTAGSAHRGAQRTWRAVIREWWRSCAPVSSSPRIPASLSRARRGAQDAGTTTRWLRVQQAGRQGQAIATGVGSVSWSAVPQGIFDAAEDTVDWRVEAARGGESRCPRASCRARA